MNFRNPKKGMAITGLAGPVSNLLLAFISLLSFRIIDAFAKLNFELDGGIIYYYRNASYSILDFIALFLIVNTFLNISLAVFNLMPIPPLDGYNIFKELFIGRINYRFFASVERYSTYILIAFLVLGDRIGIISSISEFIFDLLKKVMDLIFIAFI
jgi:Zn-dependent protease